MSDVKYDRGTIIPFHEPLSKKEVDEIIHILREHPQLYYALSFSNPVIDEFIVEIMPSAILQMKNPTEKLQIKAITVEPSLIRFLKKPTKAVILTALKEDGMTINFVPPAERFLRYRIHAIESNPEGVKDLFTRAADSDATKNSSGGILVQLQSVLKLPT